MESRYLYELRPKMPIRRPGQTPIVRPCTMHLTKDEVRDYMKQATVYRKFANGDIERVTGENLSKLHQSEKKETVSVQPQNTEPTPQQNQYRNYNGKHGSKNHDKNHRGDDRGKTSANIQVPALPYQQEQQNESNDGNAFAGI